MRWGGVQTGWVGKMEGGEVVEEDRRRWRLRGCCLRKLTGSVRRWYANKHNGHAGMSSTKTHTHTPLL